jgi:hypothetical protein
MARGKLRQWDLKQTHSQNGRESDKRGIRVRSQMPLALGVLTTSSAQLKIEVRQPSRQVACIVTRYLEESDRSAMMFHDLRCSWTLVAHETGMDRCLFFG